MIHTRFLWMAAALLSSVTAASVYERPLDLVYALQNMKGLPQYDDSQLLAYIDQVSPSITAVVPFFLNVNDLSPYRSMIKSIQKRNITIVPAVGGSPTDGDIYTKENRGIANGYRTFTDYIRLENMQGFYDNYTATGIQDMINYCVGIGFKHIMLNPWPTAAGGGAVPFANPEVDSTIFQVLLDQNKTTNEPIQNPTNWYPGNQNKINATRTYRPSVEVLINYESPPQQDVLTNIEMKHKNASIDAMQITINKINGQYKSENLHWIPPLDQSYNAIGLGTWNWIAEKLSQM